MRIPTLLEGYRSGEATPRSIIASLLPLLDADPALWISRFSDRELLARAQDLSARDPESLPLYGVPFAVKDNIDVEGLPTTAACPAFSYQPDADAPVVRALREAGAICLGKTNLDQFATGLVGVRSPHGVPANPFGASFIPGGSSSGSAVAVARGLAAFALGTDTAGSGRVPAAFNNLYGWKPTRGLLSTRGVVPACRSLDCVSVFANSPDDLQTVSRIVCGFDPGDPFARNIPLRPRRQPQRIGIPLEPQLEFFGDADSARLWRDAVRSLEARGLRILEVDISAFLEAARLLYEGPWVAERFLATKDFLGAMHPVTRSIIEKGREGTAADAFAAQYRLADLKRRSEPTWESIDVLCLPTAPTIFTLAEVEADPITTNSRLGTYTNFLNLLDLCGLAVPAGFRPDGLPFGITFVARAHEDKSLFALAGTPPDAEGTIDIAVCGAHMSGLPLNHQLTSRGGEFLRAACTAPAYRLFALDEKRPGLVRVANGGASLALEVWRLPETEAGSFLAGIPSPLGLGRVILDDGSETCGFLCEACAAAGKPDITTHGGWRAWLKARP